MFLSGRWKSTSSEMRVGSSGTSALQCGCWVLLFPQGSPALTTSCFTMSGKSTNPAVLHFIWITLMFLTAAVTADCRGNRCRTQIQGFWRMADRQKASDQRDFRGGFRDTQGHSGDQSHQTVNQTKEGERISSLFSVGRKVFQRRSSETCSPGSSQRSQERRGWMRSGDWRAQLVHQTEIWRQRSRRFFPQDLLVEEVFGSGQYWSRFWPRQLGWSGVRVPMDQLSSAQNIGL